MSSSDTAIQVKAVNKCFHIYNSPKDRLKQFLMPFFQKLVGKKAKHYYQEFWALKNISFNVKKGEMLGIVGRNGAGKSTLLQIICGTLAPSSGRVEITGRVAALLELGSGFNPEFTGKENIYMNGAVLGLTKEELNNCFNDIVKFADIGDFLEQPVKTYSSGMMLRLAFAVIIHVKADILVIDEALAVGDVFFQQKCMRYLRSFQDNGGTILFVSHDTGAVVSLCDRAVMLAGHGKEQMIIGNAEEISRLYVKELYAEREINTENVAKEIRLESSTSRKEKVNESQLFIGAKQADNLIEISSFRSLSDSFGKGGAKIYDAWFEDAQGSKTSTVIGGDLVKFCLQVKIINSITCPAFGFMIKDRLGQYLFAEGTDVAFRDYSITAYKGNTCVVSFLFTMPILIQGEYSINVAVAEGVGHEHIQHHWINDAITFRSISSRLVHGLCGLQGMVIELEIDQGKVEANGE